MEPEIQNCRRCGRLYSAPPDQRLCASCAELNLKEALAVDEAVDRHGLSTVEEITAYTGLSAKSVIAVIRASAALRERVDLGEICEHCREATAQAGSRYCPSCRLTLSRAFEDASGKLVEKLVRLAVEGEAQSVKNLRLSVVQALNRKRRLTRGERFDPTPRNKYSA